LKFVNGYLVAERRGRTSFAEISGFLSQLEALPIIPDTAHIFSRTFTVIASFGLSSYDATYLELALRERLPLLTVDLKLHAAAHKAGVPLAVSR
jgi:predicted nucleic acid-binding protein